MNGRYIAIADDRSLHLLEFTDRKALRQILINLISNAIKYSKQGDPVEISVSESDVFVTFGVRDRGEGMPPEEVARLGEPFFQGENAKSRAEMIGKSLDQRLNQSNEPSIFTQITK